MYEIILYDTEDGRCPVQELLDSLEPKLLAKTLRTIIKKHRRHQRQKKNWQRSIKQIMNGTRNPSLSMVKKLAQGLGMQLKLEFVPMPTKNKM